MSFVPDPSHRNWQAFVQPLTSSETAQVINDLFDAGEALIGSDFGPCLAPVYHVRQASPPRVTSVASEPNFAGLGYHGETELIHQVGWAWTMAWEIGSSAGGEAHRAMVQVGRRPSRMPADAWAWIIRARNLDGNPFASVADARAAIPS